MNPRREGRRWLVGLLSAACLAPLSAHASELVAPHVPTPQSDVELMLEVIDVGPGDYLIDLGSGDGRIVIEAARRGAVGHGIELERELVEQATRRAREAGVADRVLFERQDIFEADISQASVVTLYLMPEANMRLRPILLDQLRPGTRVVSNNFHMEDWRTDAFHDSRSSGGLHVWIIPAQVTGRWLLELEEQTLELTIEQHFQEIRPRLKRGETSLRVEEPALRGDRIAFVAREGEEVHYTFSGRVDGDAMSGYVQYHGGGENRLERWQARRRE